VAVSGSESKKKPKKKESKVKKTSQYYRLKPPPKSMIQCSGDIKRGSGAAVAVSPNSNQNSARDAIEPNLITEQEDILDGQNNLKRQL
jgi:hypothetical protein